MVLLKSLCFLVVKLVFMFVAKFGCQLFSQNAKSIITRMVLFELMFVMGFAIARCEVCIIALYIAGFVIRDNMFRRCSVLVLLVVFVYLLVLQIIVLALCYNFVL